MQDVVESENIERGQRWKSERYKFVRVGPPYTATARTRLNIKALSAVMLSLSLSVYCPITEDTSGETFIPQRQELLKYILHSHDILHPMYISHWII